MMPLLGLLAALAFCAVVGWFLPPYVLLLCLIVVWLCHWLIKWADGQRQTSEEPVKYIKNSKPKFKINRSISVPKGSAGCYLMKQKKFDPKEATKERRKKLKELVEELPPADDISLDGPCPFQRSSSIRRSGRTNGIGSTGDLTDIPPCDVTNSLPNIKLWSKSCGNLRFQREKAVQLIDSWDGLQQILKDSEEDDQRPVVHFHYGPIVHVDGTNDVQIGNHNVMKVDRTHSEGSNSNDIDVEETESEVLETDGEELLVFEEDDEIDVSELDSLQSVDSILRRESRESSSLTDRGTSYHDPDDPDDFDFEHPALKDMSTGTTMSLLRGNNLETCLQMLTTPDEGQEVKPKKFLDERTKIIEELRRFRELKSDSAKKRGSRNPLKLFRRKVQASISSS